MDKDSIEEKILKQVEFYFSDSNIQKDRFMIEKIAENPKGYVDIHIIASFKKIKQLSTDLSYITKVLEKSKLLKLNKSKTKIRRRNPVIADSNVDERTIYVDHLDKEWDHDTVRHIFEDCGLIDYVSLPRDKMTQEFKGFGFVEIEESIDKALTYNQTQKETWKNPIVVITKEEWLHKKSKYINHPSQDSKYNNNNNNNIKQNINKTISKNQILEQSSNPLLLFTNIDHHTTENQIRQLFEIIHPLTYFDYNQMSLSQFTKQLNTTSIKVDSLDSFYAIIRYNDLNTVKAAIEFFTKQKQYSLSDFPIQCHELTKEEENFYWKFSEEHVNIPQNNMKITINKHIIFEDQSINNDILMEDHIQTQSKHQKKIKKIHSKDKVSDKKSKKKHEHHKHKHQKE